MSHRVSPTSQEVALQRGKACLSCRRRKMKCDGERPYCSQCVRGNRAEDCEYTDNQGRTRTQMLEENVALLQARIHELENPRIASQSVYLHDPYSGTSSTQQPAIPPRTPRSNPFDLSWWEVEEPPAQMTQMLIYTFLPHAESLGFGLSTRQFLSDLSLPTVHPNRPHPALLHAVLLWSLRLSKSSDFMQHENIYLQRSILALQDALGHESDLDGWIVARHRLHATQAEVLLATYFFGLGRLLEGRYHANAAVTLSVSCGLHRVRPFSHGSFREPTARLGINALELPPAQNALEHGERVRVFWAVYSLDRCWSASLDTPCVLTDDVALGTQIDTEWPMEIVDYEENSDRIPNISTITGRTVQRFVSGEPSTDRGSNALSRAALRVMASVVYERTARISQLWLAQSPESLDRSSMRTEMQTLARTTMQFARGLIPVDQLPTSGHEGYESLFVVHGLAHAAMLALHRMRATDAPSQELNAINSALVHASEILKIIERLSADDTVLLDPVLSIIGFSAAHAFVEEKQRVRHLQESQRLPPEAIHRLSSLQTNISRILDALRRCSGASSTGALFSQQVDRILDITEDP